MLLYNIIKYNIIIILLSNLLKININNCKINIINYLYLIYKNKLKNLNFYNNLILKLKNEKYYISNINILFLYKIIINR